MTCKYSSSLLYLNFRHLSHQCPFFVIFGHHRHVTIPSLQRQRFQMISTSSTNMRRKYPIRTRAVGVGCMSKENGRLAEVITIYEKLTKSRGRKDDDVFRLSGLEVGWGPMSSFTTTIPNSPSTSPEDSATVLDFSKFRNIRNENYSYFSASKGLLQGSTSLMHLLSSINVKDQNQNNVTSSSSSSPTEQFCLCIENPKEADLDYLRTRFHVHDLTIRDIVEENTEEKVEVFKHYTFISLKVYVDVDTNNDETPKAGMDLNVLLFPDCAIILHYGESWNGFKDMLGFLNLLCTYGDSPLTPDWVLFSIMIELAQDAKYSVKELEPKILNLRVGNSTPPPPITTAIKEEVDAKNNQNDTDLSSLLTRNFENEFEIYKINRFIKPKIRVIKELETKCGNARMNKSIQNLLVDTRKDFEEMAELLDNFNHILERSQDTYLTLANVRQSQEANDMGRTMKRISEVALLFLPLQAVTGFLGMNVHIPMQNWCSTLPFWCIVSTSSIAVAVLFASFRRSQIQSQQKQSMNMKNDLILRTLKGNSSLNTNTKDYKNMENK